MPSYRWLSTPAFFDRCRMVRNWLWKNECQYLTTADQCQSSTLGEVLNASVQEGVRPLRDISLCVRRDPVRGSERAS
jgi:hypothetical protein